VCAGDTRCIRRVVVTSFGSEGKGERGKEGKKMPNDADARDIGARFEMVTFPEPTGIPHGWDAELLRQGVPKALFGRFEAANEVTLLEVPHDGQLVCFGTSGLDGSVCLDPQTGAVVEITYVPTGTINLPSGVHGPQDFVNSSLEQFIASVRAVLDRFPFDSEGTEEDRARDDLADEWAHQDKLANEWDRAGGELDETLRRIDPAVGAVPRDGFWMTFVGDVQMGAFSTRDGPG
jgi:SUKH-4 immunity protein